jgi:pimeloyl-ACP methyl ester carboxylesterase
MPESDWCGMANKANGVFPKAELAVIPAAGHEMFAENPKASIAAVRAYLDAPVR